jgi:UrcA family protein
MKSMTKLMIPALVALSAGIAALTPIYTHADDFSPRSVRVSLAHLDPNSAEGARKIYARLEAAAWTACGESDLDIEVIALGHPSECVREALAHAVRDMRSIQLSQLYIKRNGANVAKQYDVTPDILTASQ